MHVFINKIYGAPFVSFAIFKLIINMYGGRFLLKKGINITLSQKIPVLLLNVWIFNKQLHLFL
jgi:hypothetical protein